MVRAQESQVLKPSIVAPVSGGGRDQSLYSFRRMRRRIRVVHVPGVRLARTYRRAWLRGDIVAGLVLTALLVPQGMAYAELAGLPPVTGLYTTVLALVGYAVFGPSRILVLGPDSALGPLIAAALLPLVGARERSRQSSRTGLDACAAHGCVLCIAAGFARLGVLAELLSKPVRVGFLNGIAVLVVVGQLPKLFGFSSTAQGLVDEVDAFVSGLRDGDTVPASLVVGLGSLAVILVLRRLQPKVPGVLVAVIGAAIVVSAFDLTAHGVSVVGAIPSGFPGPTVPDVSFHEATSLLVAAAGIAFVMLADTTALSRSLAARHGEHVDANEEIRALGAANAAAGLFQGFPVSASASRTIVAESSGVAHAGDRRRRRARGRRDPARAEQPRSVHRVVDPGRDHHRRRAHAVRLREPPLAVEGATVRTVALTRRVARSRRPRCARGHPRRDRALARQLRTARLAPVRRGPRSDRRHQGLPRRRPSP